jgi:ATP-binding cassette subfamily B protein
MFFLNAPLTLVTAISLPITLLVGMMMRKRIYPVSWLIQARLADVATLVEENVSGVRVVKSFAAEQKELTTLARSADKLQWSYIKDANIRGTWGPWLENLPRVGLAVILLYGGVLVLHGHLGVGTLFTFQAYMLIFQPPFRQLGMVIMNGQRASASAKRIYEVLDQPQEIVNTLGAVDLVECHGDVVFDHVSFAYSDGTEVLHDFSLHLAPGETVAIVGRTGSGKTTAGRLLNRSYDVTEGRLLLDGHDVRAYTLESLRAHVGFVFDEPFLFSVSVRDNIAYGKPGATMDEVIAAAKAADADEFIVRMPEGYETIVGERGYTLSGGQRQRMAIARTLLVNPPVLVLDDATSAIDVQVEQRIHSSLQRLMTNRTTLIIAHRLATIALADRVALVESGHVIASGRHEYLLQHDPRYAEVLARVDDESGASDEDPG